MSANANALRCIRIALLLTCAASLEFATICTELMRSRSVPDDRARIESSPHTCPEFRCVRVSTKWSQSTPLA
ncbi:hypothetical protein B0H19DRAFT_1123885 [Mycena capillaripes]|nr:hypothetical protein B0H19DRAFT_1176081 [Mycena capillaripes]KAJ6541370.1 hypothetical protein B0H19DRAFT_1173037 [Mycena capillaripes]KAJ6558300.1 hypothetical protein B0H19DRAFT_1150718 [Mycena capillaripes]KAJ6574200.1 hypothetical protein B0H19DRAFT_1123885 [Mycena capillaripes]